MGKERRGQVNAPKCKLCGHTHWANEPHKGISVPSQVAKPAFVARPVPSHDVTTTAPLVVPSLVATGSTAFIIENAGLKTRIAELEAEVAALKTADADRRQKHRDKMAARRAK